MVPSASFYGTTSGGGIYGSDIGGYGTVFNEIRSNGALTSLYSLTGTNDGEIPRPRWYPAATV